MPEQEQIRGPFPWYGAVLFAILLLPLTVILLTLACRSLAWETAHDTPIMMYMAFLMDQFDFVPHRDFFDMNLAGSHLSYLAIGKLFGYSDLALRWADLTVLSILSLLIFRFMLTFGWRAAWASVTLFGLRYLMQGEIMTLQRECLALVPLMMALLSSTVWFSKHPRLRFVATGLCFGLTMTIKPHFIVGAPLVWLYLAFDDATAQPESRLRSLVTTALWCSLGGIVPVAAMFGYYAHYGVLGSFIDAATSYLPLYGDMNGEHVIFGPGERKAYIITNFFRLGGYGMWLAPACLGIFMALTHAGLSLAAKRRAQLLGGMIAAYALYPVFTAQFFDYHWLPLVFFFSICTGLCFMNIASIRPIAYRLLPLGLLLFLVAGTFYTNERLHKRLNGYAPVAKQGRPAAIAAYLAKHMKPGDTVQGLDWAATGVAHGLLRAEAELATPFIYYFHFFHHVSTDYIKELRARFVTELKEAKPRFIVEGKQNGIYVRGPDSALRFVEVEAYMAEAYTQVLKRRGFIIWERKLEVSKKAGAVPATVDRPNADGNGK